MRQDYYILSGEGEMGTWSKLRATEWGLKRRLTKERQGGDRWARGYRVFMVDDGVTTLMDIHNNELRAVSTEMLDDLD